MTTTAIVNGKRYSVVGLSGDYIYLRGSRGAERTMVRAIRSGEWYLVGGGSWRRTASELVETFEVEAA